MEDFQRNKAQLSRQGIFRSGELVNIAQADQQKLVEDYQIKRIYDFRSAAETQERPDDSIQGTNYLHIDILADIQAQTASLEGMLKTVGSPDEAMDMAYKEMVLSIRGAKVTKHFLKTFKLSTGSYFISLFRRKRSNRNRRSLDIKCFRCGTFLYFRRLFKDERAKKNR